MDKHEAHEIILKQVCKEIERYAEELQKSQTMSSQMVECLDKLYHIKKDMLTCLAMEESDEYGEEGWSSEGNGGGNSGRRGRSSVTGRYVSRDGGSSYAEGYSQGYSEAINQMNGGNSGHYPMTPPYYPARRY